ncbi:septation protein IspZ [Phenylobacterium sp.]|uniref:inner membrane-spanning protein YciB n=1 Tax=Phenylobacterium sp. TaxID=1871053 RepID=UPI00121A2094|nr:septation protein IspZ [Phenylobacterium sp.]THD61750.1 MAG: intracellular septation protein [Phenylobacterium sp.]
MKDLLFAVRPLLSDFFPTIVFAVLMALHVDVAVATGAALLIGVGQVLVQKALKRPVELLQWASLGLVVLFGTLGILTNDPRFLMIKPTIIYFAIGVVMLRRGWMIRYLPADAVEHVADLQIGWGYAWSALMFVTGVANGLIAWSLPADWPAFIAVAPLASKGLMFAVHFGSVRYIGYRRQRAGQRALAAKAAEPAAAQATAEAA